MSSKPRVVNIGGKNNRKIILSEANPGQYHDIQTGYQTYNLDLKNPNVGPPINLASDSAIKNNILSNEKQRMTIAQDSYRNANIKSARQHEQNKARGTSSSSVRRIIK